MTSSGKKWLNEIRWDDQGLVPVITEDAQTGDVLMFAFMNRDALDRTIVLGEVVYWSRSRRKLWHKGEESGHTQKVVEIRTDCDKDVILIKVEQTGGIACHTGRRSCFYNILDLSSGAWREADPVLKDPAEIYSV